MTNSPHHCGDIQKAREILFISNSDGEINTYAYVYQNVYVIFSSLAIFQEVTANDIDDHQTD